jgi:hypothetical protein
MINAIIGFFAGRREFFLAVFVKATWQAMLFAFLGTHRANASQDPAIKHGTTNRPVACLARRQKLVRQEGGIA